MRNHAVLFCLFLSALLAVSCSETSAVEVSPGLPDPVETVSGEGIFSSDSEEQMAGFLELLDGLPLEPIEITEVGTASKRAYFEYPEGDVDAILEQRLIVEEHFISQGFTVIDRVCPVETFDYLWGVEFERDDGVVLSARWGRGVSKKSFITLPYDNSGRPHTRVYFGQIDGTECDET